MKFGPVQWSLVIILPIIVFILIKMVSETRVHTKDHFSDDVCLQRPFVLTSSDSSIVRLPATTAVTLRPKALTSNVHMLYTDSYTGGFLKVNEDIPGTTTRQRSSTLNSQIQNECSVNIAKFASKGLDPYEPKDWADGTNYGHGKHGYMREMSGTYKGENVKGGPCLWCPKGIGNHIPKTINLPYQGNIQLTGASSATSCQTFATRFEKFVIELKEPSNFFENYGHCSDGGHYDGHSLIPYDLQPNGGIQFAYHSRSRPFRVHLVYLDPQFNRVHPDDIIMEGKHVLGVAALNNGTITVLSQLDCDAPAARTPDASMIKAVAIRWENGTIKWAKRVTDPYRAGLQTDNEDRYETMLDGVGTYIGAFNYIHGMAFDRTTDQVSFHVDMTGDRGAHWGSRFFTITRDGRVVQDSFGCSHDIGSNIIADNGKFVQLCQDDGWGFHTPESEWFGPRRGIIKEFFLDGWHNSSRMGGIVKRKTAPGYFIPIGSLNDYVFDPREKDTPKDRVKMRLVPDHEGNWLRYLYIIELDAQLNATRRIPYFGNDRSDPKVDYNNFRMAPYGNPNEETYLIYYTVHRDCQHVLEKGVHTPVFQVIRYENGTFVPVTPVYNVEDLYIPIGARILTYPNGDLLWAMFTDEKGAPLKDGKDHITFVRMKNCF